MIFLDVDCFVMAGDENECTYGTSTTNITTNTMWLLQMNSQESRKRNFRSKELVSHLMPLKQLKTLNSCPFWLRLISSSLVTSSWVTQLKFSATTLDRIRRIFRKQRVNQIILLKMYIHAGRHKHTQQSEQGGLYSPCEWLSVSFVAVMWMGQMNAKGNEQRWAEGNRSGDSCITFVLSKWSLRTLAGLRLEVTMRAHMRISPGLNLSLKQCISALFYEEIFFFFHLSQVGM